MSGPAGALGASGSPDDLDQALALANDAPVPDAAGGACAHCPARTGTAPPGTGGPGRGPAARGAGAGADDMGAPSASRGAAAGDDDLAPSWLLGSGGREAAVPGDGRPPRGVRRARPGDHTPAQEAPGDDGLLPEWLPRAARRAGRDRPGTTPAAEATDPDDALAAPWVPRLPARGRRPPDGPGPADGAGPVPGGEHAPSPPARRATPVPAVPEVPAAPPRPVFGAGEAAGDPAGHGGPAGEGPPVGPAQQDAGGEQPPYRPADGVCPHAGGLTCGEHLRTGRPAAGTAEARHDAPDVAAASGEPGRGGAPAGRHDGPVTSHRAAAGAESGTPADVTEASPPVDPAGRAPSAPAPSPGRAPGTPSTGAGKSPHGVDGAGHRAAEHPRAPATWDEAQRAAARAAAPAAAETVPLERAARQVLAAPVEALADLPSFDTAAMDGWAVAGPGPWTPAGPPGETGVLAGQTAPAPLADGCAVRIATGARMPDGATAVLRSERAELRGGRLHVAPGAPPHSDQHGTDVRPRGQECRTGDRLLPAGTPVTPPVLGLAAAAGYDRLAVTPRPRVEVLVLGDELLHSGLPSGGRVRDALGPMVGPWLAALGAEVLVTRRLGDDAEALHEAVATTTADLVVTTGGTAHGPVDHVRPTLRRVGARVLVDGVEVRPGHPMLLAALSGGQQGRHLVGLPGNPLAAASGLLTLAAPLLRARAGLPEPEPVRATLTAEVQGHPRDTRLVPVTRSADGAGATPLRWTGPAMLRGIAGASALAAVPPGGAAAGTSVRLLELPW